MKNAIKLLGLVSLTSLAPCAMSDTILGLYLGAGVWQTELTGSANQTGSGQLDIDNTFGDVEEDNNFFYAALEHPIPVLPNILVQMSDAVANASGTMTSNIIFGGQAFTVGQAVTTNVDFSHLDATLYYELLDNVVSIDLGLTFRQFDGAMRVRAGVSEGIEELEGVIPLIYLKGRVDIPITGLYVTATGNAIGYDGNTLTDLSAAVGWQSDGWVMDLGVEVGMRSFTFELEDLDGLDTNLDVTGAYAALTIHF